MKKFFTLILVLVGICSAQAALIDFETANTDWQFIQDGQTNYWTIGSAAGSASAGSNALYITNYGNYGYNNSSSSVSWAYIPISVTSSSSNYISFSWKGTGESCCDNLSVYLFPEGTLPTVGSTNTYGATALVEQLSGASDWQSFSVSTQELSTGIYNLCFMWRNDASVGEMPIAIDDVNVNVNIEMPIQYVHNHLTYLLFSDSTASIISCAQSYDGALSIPNTITYEGTTYSVTSIGSSAFYNCSALASITIPNSVTSIGSRAFYNCSSLTSITIPNSVTSIGSEAFSDCSALTSITIPNSVTNIGDYAFSDCSALTSITIPNSVTNFDGYIFCDCSALKSVTLPDNMTSIRYGMFQGCASLDSVTIPNSVTSIESSAFYNCSALTSITIPNSVQSIGSSAFSYCSALTSITWNAENCSDFTGYWNAPFYNIRSQNAEFIFGDKVQHIPAYLCYEMNTLTSVTIPNSVTSIGTSAFSGCYALTSITWNAENCSDFTGYDYAPFYGIRSQITKFVLGDKVQHIPAYLCYGMNTQTSVTIPNSVTSIGSSAFYNSIEVLFFESEIPATIGQNSVFGSNTLLIVPNADTYKAAWTQYKDQIIARSAAIVEVSTTAHTEKSALHQELGLDAFQNIISLKINGTINSYDIMMLRNQMPLLRELDLSEASIVANTYEYTKGYCSKNDTLTSQAFTGTGTKISTVILPKSLKYIEAGAFNYNLRSLTIHNGTIAENAFEYLYQLQEVTLLNTTAIPANAFFDCSSLCTISLPETLETISDCAFYGCSALQAITLPESLKTIGKYAFQGAGLRSITIPANVSSLGVGAFAGGSRSSSYEYYSSATSNSKSDYYATSSCSSNSSSYYYNYGGSLREVTIPKESKLKTIPSRAFEGNESLTKLSILGDSITSIADVAFRRCALDTLILPPNLTSLSTLSFGYCTGLKFIAMPNSLTEIPANAFVGCTNLNDIQFPRKLTHIGHHAFADCSNLSNVDIPGLVTSIGDYAFKDCNVNSVYSYLFDPFTIGQNTFSAYANANAILYVPNLEDTEMKYLYDTQWSQFLHRVRMDKDFEYDDFYANGDVVIGDQDDPLNGDPNANLNPGSGLVVEGDSTQNLGTVILTGEPGDWASILAGCNLNVDTLILQLKVTGHQWHFFGFPFEIKISDIFTEGNFVIYEYDGAIRAERDTTGWKKLPTGQDCLYPGHGYIFQFDFAVDGYFSIKLNKPNFCKLVELINLFIYPASNPHNQSWNYVSNPLLAYYDINDLNYTGPITFWNELLETYQTYRPGDDEYYISPYEAFFLQNANLQDNFALFFDRSKAMTKKQRDERSNSKYHLPAKKTDEPARERFLINLLISDGTYSDQTRVVINSNASLDYELGVDAAKFLSTEKVPQLFSYDADHAMCAINERPMDNGTVQLGIQLPKSGTYSISAARMDTTFYLFDKQENITHDFQQGDYYFDGKSGLNDQRFELVRTPKRVPTAIEDINTTTITPTADGLIVEGNDYIQIYSMTGVMMAEGQLSGLVQLPNGVYVVVCNGNATKHTVQ